MADVGDEASEALEWFTDPMTNIFAVFMFIVMMLGLLNAIRHEVAAPATPDTASASVEAELVRAEDAALVGLEQDVRSLESPDRQWKRDRIAALRAERDRLKGQLAKVDQVGGQAMGELLRNPSQAPPDVSSMLENLKASIEHLKSAITDAKAKSELELSAPSEHELDDAFPTSMVLSKGRAHRVTSISDAMRQLHGAGDEGWYLSLEAWDPECVDVARSRLERMAPPPGRRLSAEQHIQLKSGGGLDLRQTGWSGSDLWKRWMHEFRMVPARSLPMVYLFVDADSHAEFMALRGELVRAGIAYNVRPMQEPFICRWVNGKSTAQ